jgi:hypothetical protein
LKFDGKAGVYRVKDVEDFFNNKEAVAHVYQAAGGRIKFDRDGGQPERRMGSVFPDDESPARADLGNLEEAKWPRGRFSDEPEDPWTAVIEIPITIRETGDQFMFVAQSKGSLAAAKDLLSACRKLDEGYEPKIRLAVGTYKTRHGEQRKPVLQVIGRIAVERGPDDEIPF